ncbi:MAG: APC family permease [Dehalococcoidia bacterium]
MNTTDDEQQPGDPNEGGADSGRPPAEGRSAPLTPDLELREIRRGAKPGSRYVRVQRRSERAFERLEEGEYRATAIALRPRTRLEGVWLNFKRIVVGAPLATSQLLEERLSKLKALAVYSSDMLSSSAYATEEILLVLLLAGPVFFNWSIPISIAIAVLVVVVAVSYSQVIRGYPNGGGSYAVAKANLGTTPALLAGASLVVDYILTVAVSTAAGVAAIVSAVPELQDWRIEIAVGAVAVLTLANLRGARESGTYFAIPAYFFILSITALIITGFVRLALGSDITAAAPDHAIEPGTQALGLFLILRAFSSGAAALTGIEAVSNGVPSFKPPEARNANITLAWMAAILTFFFVGLTILAHQVGATPSETQTIVAQVGEGVFGRNVLFYAVQIGTTLILLLAANTSFAGLPSLGSVMARDRFLPRQFAFRGDRLAFSNGIIFLGLASMGLLVAFQADTHRLIPLYAVGVFAGFTLSQTGMVRHWLGEQRNASTRLSLAVNAVGAVATAVVTIIIISTKLIDGAWITIGAIALLSFFFSRIHHHYQRVQIQLEVDQTPSAPERTAPAERQRGRVVLVPVDDLNQAVLRTIDFAHSISDNVTAVHVTDDIEEAEELRSRWDANVADTPIVIIESPYRSFLAPMLTYIDAIDKIDPDAFITVVLPEFVPAHFWEGLLHNQTAVRLKKALRYRPNTILIDVPYHLQP